MYNKGTHPEAVQRFLVPELAAGGMTSVWSSGRFTTWARRWSILKRLEANTSAARRYQSHFHTGKR